MDHKQLQIACVVAVHKQLHLQFAMFVSSPVTHTFSVFVPPVTPKQSLENTHNSYLCL